MLSHQTLHVFTQFPGKRYTFSFHRVLHMLLQPCKRPLLPVQGSVEVPQPCGEMFPAQEPVICVAAGMSAGSVDAMPLQGTSQIVISKSRTLLAANPHGTLSHEEMTLGVPNARGAAMSFVNKCSCHSCFIKIVMLYVYMNCTFNGKNAILCP